MDSIVEAVFSENVPQKVEVAKVECNYQMLLISYRKIYKDYVAKRRQKRSVM